MTDVNKQALINTVFCIVTGSLTACPDLLLQWVELLCALLKKEKEKETPMSCFSITSFGIYQDSLCAQTTQA